MSRTFFVSLLFTLFLTPSLVEGYYPSRPASGSWYVFNPFVHNGEDTYVSCRSLMPSGMTADEESLYNKEARARRRGNMDNAEKYRERRERMPPLVATWQSCLVSFSSASYREVNSTVQMSVFADEDRKERLKTFSFDLATVRRDEYESDLLYPPGIESGTGPVEIEDYTPPSPERTSRSVSRRSSRSGKVACWNVVDECYSQRPRQRQPNEGCRDYEKSHGGWRDRDTSGPFC